MAIINGNFLPNILIGTNFADTIAALPETTRSSGSAAPIRSSEEPALTS